MVSSPRNRHRVIANEFPVFVVGGTPIKFFLSTSLNILVILLLTAYRTMTI